MLALLKTAVVRHADNRLSRKCIESSSKLLLSRRNGSSKDIFPNIHYPFTKQTSSQAESNGLPIEFDSDHTSQNLSPHIVEAMLEESVKQRDFKTSKLLMQQYFVGDGVNGASVMSKTLELHLSELNFAECETVLRICTKKESYKIPVELAEQCLAQCVHHLQWKTAYVCMQYFLTKQLPISPEALSLTLSGLMGYNYPKGVGYALELVGSFLQHERDDLLQSSPSGATINNINYEQGKTLQPALIKSMEVWLKRCRNTKITLSPSLSATQLLVSLSMSTGHTSLAAEFTRKAVIALDRRVINTSDDEEVKVGGVSSSSSLSLLSLLPWEQHKKGSPMSLIQSLTTAHTSSNIHSNNLSSSSDSNNEKDVSVDVSLLQLAIDHPPYTQNNNNNNSTAMTPFAAGDYFYTLFSLEHRLQGIAHILPQGVDTLPTDLLVDSMKPLQRIYSSILDFMQDESRVDMTVTLNDFYYERRAWRVLCDEIGHHQGVNIRCRVNRSPSMTRPSQLVLKKEKGDNTPFSSSSSPAAITLDQLLRDDYTHLINNNNNLSSNSKRLNFAVNHVKLSPLPIYWSQMKEMLMELSPSTLCAVATRLVNNNSNNSMSVSWLLLIAEIMQVRKLSLPVGFIQGGIIMAAKNHDFYGLMELLYLALDTNKSRLFSPAQQRQQDTEEEQQKVEEGEAFSPFIWQQAMSTALFMRRQIHSLRSYEENVLEILGMRKSTYPTEAPLTNGITRGILRFLVLTSDDNNHRTMATARSMLVKSLSSSSSRDNDSNSNTAVIGKSECLAASMLLLKAQVMYRQSSQSSTTSSAWSMFSDDHDGEIIHSNKNSKYDLFQLTSPVFYSEIYLTPISIDKLQTLRHEFRSILQIDSNRAAEADLDSLNDVIEDEEKMAKKLKKARFDSMNSVTQFDQATRQEHLPQGRELLLILVRQQMQQLLSVSSEGRDMKRVGIVSNMAIHTACLLSCNDARYRSALSLLMSALDLYPAMTSSSSSSASAMESKEKRRRKRQQQQQQADGAEE